MTQWRTIKKAVDAPGNLKLLRQALRALRGAASEMVLGRATAALFPRHTVVARRVLLKNKHIVDFDLKDATGVLHNAVEVKGWTANTWRQALQAWRSAQRGVRLDSQQEQLLRQLARLVAQLRDASQAPRGIPYLVVTDKLSPASSRILDDFLMRNSLNVRKVLVRELEIVETSRRLRSAFKLPELPPGNGRGGTP